MRQPLLAGLPYGIRRIWGRHFAIIAVYLLALVLFLATGLVSPSFWRPEHVATSIVLAAFLGVLAIAQTMVILLGGIDLSVPWTITMSAIIVATLGKGQSLGVAVGVALLASLGVGLLNGLGVTVLGLSPIIMTLAMNGIEQGAIMTWTGGSGFVTGPKLLLNVIGGTLIGIPTMIIIWVVMAILIVALLSLTRYGRHVYAAGSNPWVAFLSGVNVRRTIIIAYMLSALVAGIDGILLTGYLTQSYLGMGDPYLFPSIAAVVVGGVSIYGGQGGYIGPMAGALVLTLLDFLLAALGLGTNTQEIVFGVVLLIAITIPRLRAASTE